MKTIFFYFILVTASASQAQSWQWGRSGGTSATVNVNVEAQEDFIKNMVADSNGNIYAFTNVTGNDLLIDGVAVPTNNIYNFGYYATDGLLTSYDCNGNLRWYIAIGSWVTYETIRQIGIDAQNNIYVLVQLSSRGIEQPPNPVHFGLNDVLPNSPSAVNLNKEKVFLIKYNSDGVLQWYKSPQPADMPGENATVLTGVMSGLDLQVDPQGNCYLLGRLGFGPYCGGAYVTPTNTLPQNHILKYDSAGNFVSGNLIAYNFDQGDFTGKFKRNHNNGKFYIVGSVNGSQFTADPDNVYGTYLNGQYYSYLDFTRFVAEFNANGTFSWLRHNSPKAFGSDNRDIAFDSDNSIYFASGFFGSYAEIEGDPRIIDQWDGQAFDVSPNPLGLDLRVFSVLIKLSPNGDTIWKTNSATYGDSEDLDYRSAESTVKIVGNELVLSTGVIHMKWQNIININPVGSFRAGNKRFNKMTGQIIGVDFLDGIPNSNSQFRASCIDSKGNIYGGGYITSSVLVNGVTLNSNGGPNDFFIAKFGTANCDFLATAQQNFEETEVYPNPVMTVLNINNYEEVIYELYNNLGAKVLSGSLDANGKISMESLAKGMYLLQTKNANGNIKTDKIVKE